MPAPTIEIWRRNIEFAKFGKMDLDSGTPPKYRVLAMKYNNYLYSLYSSKE